MCHDCGLAKSTLCVMIVAWPRAHYVQFLITLRDLNKVLSKEL